MFSEVKFKMAESLYTQYLGAERVDLKTLKRELLRLDVIKIKENVH